MLISISLPLPRCKQMITSRTNGLTMMCRCQNTQKSMTNHQVLGTKACEEWLKSDWEEMAFRVRVLIFLFGPKKYIQDWQMKVNTQVDFSPFYSSRGSFLSRSRMVCWGTLFWNFQALAKQPLGGDVVERIQALEMLDTFSCPFQL